MGLRLAEGIDLAAMRARFGDRPTADRSRKARASTATWAWLWAEGERIGVTTPGMPLLDALLGELVPAALVAA